MANKNSSNTVQALWLGIGSLFSFGFSIISAAILSRYLVKEDYGSYRQVLYVYNTLLVVFSVGLPKAFTYFLPIRPIEEGKDIVKKITTILCVLGLFFSISLFLASDLISEILKNKELSILLKYFAPVPLFMLPTMGLEGVLSTYRQTKITAIYTVISRIIMISCIVLPIILFHGNVLNAIQGFSLSSLLTCLIALYLKSRPFKGIKSLKSNIKYKSIIKYSVPIMTASLFGIAITSADQFFISRYFGKSVFADFANGSLELPFVAMVTASTSTVLMPLFSKLIHGEDNIDEILRIWRNALNKSALIIYPLVLFCWVYADTIMTLIYGYQYQDSYIYFRIKLLINFFNIIIFAPVILAFGATKFYSNIHLIIAILTWILEYIVVSILPNNPYSIVVISVLLGIIKTYIFLVFISKILKIRLIDLIPLTQIGKVFISCSVVLAFQLIIINSFEIKTNTILVLGLTFASYILTILLIGKLINIGYLQIINPIISNIKNRIK